ncbi:MAG: hypothetical protein AAGC92_13635 [Pseudomonadota bacterium]
MRLPANSTLQSTLQSIRGKAADRFWGGAIARVVVMGPIQKVVVAIDARQIGFALPRQKASCSGLTGKCVAARLA